MRRLMLFRHAKTEHDAPSGRDQDRRLDNRGRHDAAEIGAFIGRNPPFPSLVLVSHAVRALQTWEIAWEAMKEFVPAPEVELMPELYGADVPQLLETIRNASVADPHRLMLVGHNPGMHEVAIALAGSGDAAACDALADNLPTAGLAIIDFDIDDWTDVRIKHGRLELFVTPKLLKQA
ncbi:MAG TPA: histidine phosphatase family protein [Bradyrhizobium sp.]|uniref:SixA phosphatase family protein n=1 Tax=Bradyrhizobium sp. TaxID=376 RepID=UPI002D805DD7|nr:histidine phosphatase family protein [Bradyrhizobium sp.]HET7889396.1 histidine phosphatase family protein [Bradyrhizobium sp.]